MIQTPRLKLVPATIPYRMIGSDGGNSRPIEPLEVMSPRLNFSG